MMAQRAQGGVVGRDIPIKLPLRGVHSQAEDSEVSTSFAAEVKNWLSVGTHLEILPSATQISGASAVRQRFSYEVGLTSAIIEVTSSAVTCAGHSIARSFTGVVSVAIISGQAILCGKGADPVSWNGTVMANAGFVAPAGITMSQMDGVLAHHDRVYFYSKDRDGGLDFFYGDVGAVTGSLLRFPMSRLGNITGHIVTAKVMTINAGHGMNDVVCFFTSAGQIIIYEGLDPGDANDWRQIARVQTGSPIGSEAVFEVGGDLWMITSGGVLSVQDSISRGALAQGSNISAPIADLIKAEAENTAATWQAVLFADGSAVVINRVLAGVARQFIYQFDSQALTTADLPAAWFWMTSKKIRYVGFNGSDNEMRSTGTGLVTAVLRTGWISVGRQASIAFIRPTIIAKGPLDVTLRVLSDHDVSSSDLQEAGQTVSLVPDNPADPNGNVALNDLIAVDAVGMVFRIEMEVTASWAKLVSLSARVV